MSFTTGQQIYKFTLINKLGGNFGEVWHANDNTLNKEVALKILEPSFEPVAKLLDEARIGNKFNHKNLLPIHYADVVEFNGKTFTLIAQEYFKNGSITNSLNTFNFLPLPQTLKALQDILFGLEYLHNSGFYHNDIKPGNILLDDQRNAVLADYGISGYSSSITPILPKNAYRVHSAPESTGLNPQISILSDIYQVGCTAFRLLNGISSLKNDFISLGSVEYERKKSEGKIPDHKKYEPFIPTKLKTIINKSLMVDPASRFQSALEMRRKLEKLHFPGFWTEQNSAFVGIGKVNTYHFEIEGKPNDKYNFIPSKKNTQSGNITKVTEFEAKKLSSKELEKTQKDFMNWVVENAK